MGGNRVSSGQVNKADGFSSEIDLCFGEGYRSAGKVAGIDFESGDCVKDR